MKTIVIELNTENVVVKEGKNIRLYILDNNLPLRVKNAIKKFNK